MCGCAGWCPNHSSSELKDKREINDRLVSGYCKTWKLWPTGGGGGAFSFCIILVVRIYKGVAS